MLGVVRQRVVVVEAVDLEVVQLDVLVDVNALRIHLGHVLDGGGNAEVVALGVIELAADALDLVLAGAGPQRGGERAERAQVSQGPQRRRRERRRQETVAVEEAEASQRHWGLPRVCRSAGRSPT